MQIAPLRVTLGKLQAWEIPLAAPCRLPGLASVLHTEAGDTEKSGGGSRAIYRMVEERVEGGSTRDSRRGSGATKGYTWRAHRFLELACVSLLHPLGAEVGLPVSAPPGWGQGAPELREKSLEACAATQLPNSLPGAGPSAVTLAGGGEPWVRLLKGQLSRGVGVGFETEIVLSFARARLDSASGAKGRVCVRCSASA